MWANPTGGVVASGAASISDAGTTTTINQSTAQAIINWQQFSIANNEATKFFVPTASSVTLNRVLGGNPSAIYGTLSSNGQLILINPSGIVVGSSGRIDTAGFIGSTLAMTDDDFLKGNLHFSGDGSATVDNEGTIEATGGDVYLIGGQVTNGGSISAPQGTAGLAAGSDILFEQAGDQHLYVQATPLSATRAVGVTNSGTIHAAAAELKAAGGNAYALAINNTGQITATGFKKIGGQVYLTADGADIDNSGTIVAHNANGSGGKIVLNGYGTSSKGTVLNSGKLLATGKKKGKTGGTVEVLGNQVGITGFGLVDVSGDAGGGTALIGGDEHGANAAIPDADQTYLGPNATIKADALTLGNGGKVVLWGNKTTQAYGAISVRGGAQGGNGGFVETSAKTLDAQTVPDLSAPKGTGGSWLLDPSNIYISDTVVVSTAPDASAWDPPPFTLTEDGTYDLKQDDLAQALANGSVELDASAITGTIEWSDSSEVFAPALSHATTLTLNGPGNILISGVTINTTGTAGLNLVLNSSLSTAGSIEVLESNIALNGGSFTANGQGQVSQSQYQNNSGFYLESSTLDAQGGAISITGYAGYGNNNGLTDAGDGVFFNNTGQGKVLVTTSGTGNITIKGYSSQDITSSQGFTGVGIQGGGSDASSSTTVSVASGLLDIEGYVTSGTADSSTNNDNVNGVNINGGAQVEATAAGGSVTLVGDVSASTVDVEDSPNSTGSTGVNIDSYNSGSTPTTVSVVGSTGVNDGVHGVLSITGTGGTVDTTYSTQTDSSGTSALPYTQGVNIGNGADVNATGANGAIKITGTGGAITLSQFFIEDDSDTPMTTGNYTGSSQGVEIDGSTVSIAGTGGALTVLGYGGAVNAGYGNNAGDADSQGVGLEGGEGTELITVADGGSISLTGTGGALDNSNAAMVTGKSMPGTEGVSVDAGVQLEAAGSTTISITGTGGDINSGTNTDGDAIGVNIGSGDGAQDQPTLVSSVTGDITITGYGGETPDLGVGAEAHGFNGHLTTIQSTGGGNISMTGIGGTGYTGSGMVSGNSVPDSGTALIDDVLVTTNVSTTGTVPGSITLVGTGDSYSTGVVVEELNADSTVLDSSPALPTIEAGGALSIYALGGTGESINGTITAQSATFGAETTYFQTLDAFVSNAIVIDGNPTITSGHLDITQASVTLTGGNFIAYGAGYTGFSGTNGNPDGIDVTDSTINGAGGNVTLTGTGGYVSYINDDENTTSYAGTPVSISNDNSGTTLIGTNGSGNITITGTNDTSVTSANGLGGVTIEGPVNTTSSTELSVANGLLSITGKVLSGTANGTAEYGADLNGVNVQNATLTATGNGSITLNGDVSGATSTVSGSNFSFVSGIEIGEAMITAQGNGTITLDGTGGSIDASGYTGESQNAFSVGVQLYGQTQVVGASGSTISLDGTQDSGATAVDADFVGTLINHGSLVEINGTGGEISLTGTTTGTTVTSSAAGNSNAGLEIDSLFNNGQGTGSQITEVSIDANGTLILTGTSGAVDATANSNNEDNQAGSAGIYIDGGSEIIANSGAGVTITGTGGSATTASESPTGFAGETTGVAFDDAAVTFDGDNTVLITGTGGSADDGTNVASNTSNPAQSAGVYFAKDGTASLVSVGDGSSLTVYGYGGALDTTNGSASAVGDTFPQTVGIQVNSNIEATGDATITLNGTGGAVVTSDESTPTVGASFGVGIGGDKHRVQVSSQTGAITITGTAENSPNLGIGVALYSFNGNELLLQSTSGDISITGTGGTGNSGAGSFTGFFEPNYGVAVLGHVELTTTTGGTVSITGTDGPGDVNGAGVAFLTTSDTSVDDDSIDPDLNASGAVTLNAESGGGILLATTTIEAPSLTVGDANEINDVTTVTSGPVRIFGSDLDLTGDLTVEGEGGGSGSTLADGIDLNGSTLNAGGGDISLFETGGLSNNVGIQIESGSTVETSGAGTITITGNVSNLDAQGLQVSGVIVDDATIQSATGSITLNGTVSSSSTTNGYGLQGAELEQGSDVTSTSGAISITGTVTSGSTGAPATGLSIFETSIQATLSGGSITLVGTTQGTITQSASNTGLSLYNNNNSDSESDYLVSTLNGPGISITGTSGGVSLNRDDTGIYTSYGVSIGANISTTGTAPITITGYGGDITGYTANATELQSTGADLFNETGVAETISTTGGLITIKGYGGTSTNSGFGVFLYGFSGSPYDVQSTSGNILVTGVAGGSPLPESAGASTDYEPNIGVGLGDDVSLSTTSGSITVTGTGTALADIGSWDGSGIGIQIASFAGYNDNANGADIEPATPQLSAGGTISLLSLLGTVQLGEEAQIAGSPISGNIIVSTPGEPDLSYVDNLAGTVTLNGGNFALETHSPLTVQTGTGTEPIAIDIFDSASVTLGSLSTPSLYVEADNGTITQTGPIDTGFLSGYATSITLMNTGNNIAELGEVTSGGALSIYTDPGLVLNNEVQSSGSLLLESIGGGITLNPNSSVVDTGSGNVVLVTNEAVVNNSNYGGSALEAENGYTYIYAGDSTNTSLGGLIFASTQYNTTYPAGLGSSGNSLFFSGNGTNIGGSGGPTTGGTGTGGGAGLPPVVGAPIVTTGGTGGNGITGVTGGGQLPPFTFDTGSGDINQGGSQTGGLAFASGGSGQVGSGDAAQLNNGQMNNVSNPHASGALDDALSGAVHETLEDALTSVGAFADSMTYGDTSGDNSSDDDNGKNKGKGGNTNNEQVIGPGGVVEMGGNGVQQIPPGSAPPQLQNALGNGVLQGLQPAGH